MITLKAPDFRKLLPDRQDDEQASRLVMDGVMREAERVGLAVQAAAEVRTGATRDSVNIVRRDDKVVIEAGGPLTTTETGFDYAKAREFGTSTEEAHPFFHSTIDQERPNLDGAAEVALSGLKKRS